MFKNSKFLDLGIQFFSIKSKLKQLIRFVSSIDTVKYNAKKCSQDNGPSEVAAKNYNMLLFRHLVTARLLSMCNIVFCSPYWRDSYV